MLALTVLNHPDPERVGDVAVLFSLELGGSQDVSRLEPSFQSLRAPSAEPLLSTLVSRKALTVSSPAPGQIRLTVQSPSLQVRINGQPLGPGLTLAASELARGVSVELGRFVVLLLHTCAARERSELLPQSYGLLGESDALRQLRSDITKVADTDIDVLLRGASGTGKELVARALHESSPRGAGPFVAVNVAAIPETTGAAALFGYAKGAFTGAAKSAPGYFRAAHGGTLFLDEIGEIPRALQPLLLRAIREGEVQPVGETQTQTVDVRLITATDAPLESLVENGEFALPLLKRVDGYTITLPPLRDRRDDIARLFFHFLRQELARFGEAGKLVPEAGARATKPFVPADLIRDLVLYSFPGNVAELQSLAVRVAVSNRGAPEFRTDPHLKRLLTGTAGERESESPAASAQVAADAPSQKGKRQPNAIPEVEIVDAMRRCQFKPSEAAARLGVSRAWLFNRLETCAGIRLPKQLSEADIQEAAQGEDWDVERMAARLQVSLHGLRLRLKQLGLASGSEP